MKPTQEQITAALRFQDGALNQEHVLTIRNTKYYGELPIDTCFRIMAYAYREAMAEIERLNDQIENIELEGAEYAEMRDYAD